MTRGIYAAVSGMLNRSRAIDTASNNIVNASTAGYKKDTLHTSSFGSYLTYQSDRDGASPVGTITHGVTESQVATDYTQGPVEQTGQALDLAIFGNGFFTVQLPDGQLRLTRNGQMDVNQDGYLTDTAGNLVLGMNGPVQVGKTDFTVTETGAVFSDGAYVDNLMISVPTAPQALTKGEGGLVTDNNAVQDNAFAGTIRQGYLERSNVDLVTEMSDVIASSRAYQSCSQMIKMMDQVMDKTVNDLARL